MTADVYTGLDGTIETRIDPDSGWQLTAFRMLLGNVRLLVSVPGSHEVEKGYCYNAPVSVDAVAAVRSWDGEGDPPGRWYKAVHTGQTRPEHLWTHVRPVAD